MRMNKPKIEVVRFDAHDVIVASSGSKLVSWSRLDDKDPNNNLFNVNGTEYGAKTRLEVPGALKSYYSWRETPDLLKIKFRINNEEKTFADLLTSGQGLSYFNGDYVFDIKDGSGNYCFNHQ